MGLLSGLKAKFAGSVSKYSGKTDFLEAVMAAAALVAWADGNADDKEIAAAIKAAVSNSALAGAFDSRTIEQTAEQMFNRASGGRVGRSGLYKEIEDIKADKDMSETVLLTALDIADSEGISEDEKRVLGEIASRLGLDLKKYL